MAAVASRILLMDDEEMVQRVAARTLQRLGYRVVLAEDGWDALTLYTEALHAGEPFDAVILDLMVPGSMGGVEALRRLRSLCPRVKAIASSGYIEQDLAEELRGQGFDAVVAKPYHPATLAETLGAVLAS